MPDESSRPTRAPWLTPSLADILFISQLIWLALFTIHSDGSSGLLLDANTGYHIRTGDYILEHGYIPHTDIFSFSRAGEPWYAWEWLSAVLFAVVYQAQGMKGLILLSAVVIAGANIVLLRHMVWRGANFLVAVVAMHLVIAASSIHYLARPHIFTFLFLTISLWLIDADRIRPSKWIWALVPLTALWANMHGGFLALVASLVILAAGSIVEGWISADQRSVSFSRARRYGLLAGACALASGLNPYGFAVHAHALPYLNAKWIRALVQEFQSPNFQSPEAMYFEALLFAGLALAAWLLSRKEVAAAALILAWAHAALTSVRHIPIYGFAAGPLLASRGTVLWNRWAEGAKRGSARAILGSLANDHTQGLRHTSIWAPTAVVLLLVLPLGWTWPVDFPDGRYPAAMVRKNADLIATSRVFTTDNWADYLTFQLYPRQKIFVDGRSDFFGEQISDDYVQILKGQYGWDTLIKRYDLETALIPPQSAIASLLRGNPGWRVIDGDDQAVLFRRVN